MMSKWQVTKKLTYALLMYVSISFAQAQNTINQFTVYEKKDSLYATINSRIQFSNDLNEAIKRGLNLTFSYHFIFESEKWWGEKSIATIKKNYEISYNKTIGKFEIKNPITFEKHHFKNIRDIVRKIENLKNFPLINRKQLTEQATQIKVRFELDKGQLPTLLRLENLISDEWDVESNWKIWQLP